MRKRLLPGGMFAVLLVWPSLIFAQAAAESALIHSLSSTATVQAGSTLSRSLNHASTSLGVRVQQRTSAPFTHPALGSQRTVVRNHAATNVHVGPSRAMAPASVQGGSTCAPAATANSASEPKTSAGTGSAPGCTGAPVRPAKPEDKYKSFVTLTFPK